MKLSIIGTGNMGYAIASGLSKSGIINASDICCADHSIKALERIKSEYAAISITTDNVQAIQNADIVIIAVKPYFVKSVIDEIKEFLNYNRQLFVSIASGVNLLELANYLCKDNNSIPALFRIIPNTAIEVRESVNFISSYNAIPEQIDIIKGLFDHLGLTIVIEESLMKAGTALSSCGIAFAFRYIRAAIEGAVELGLHPSLAKTIELQTLKGAIALLDANGNHPEAEIDKVTTPGGITIKGLNAMEECGFSAAVIKGLKMAQ